MLSGQAQDLRPSLSSVGLRERPSLASKLADSLPPRNQILRTLPDPDLERLRPLLDRVSLHRRQVLHERNVPVIYGYFIESGLASVMSRAGDRGSLELCTLGHHDFAGLPLALGTMRWPHRCVVQVEGEALRIRADDLRDAMAGCETLRLLLMRYVQARMVQSSHLLVCSSCHGLDQRLARWLLFAQDQLERDDIPVTHQFLSKALGVRRASVTLALARMEEAELIRRSRGHFGIVSRAGLEGATCECYRAIRAEHDRLLAPTGIRKPLAECDGHPALRPVERAA